MSPLVAVSFNIWTNTNTACAATGSLGGVCFNSIIVLIGNFIRLGLFAAGLLAVIFIIIGGLQYVTSSGNPQGTAKAKNTITYAIIGLLIAIFSAGIVTFIIDRLI